MYEYKYNYAILTSFVQLQSLPRFQVSRHSPMDYEKVLVSHKDDLKQEEFPNLLLFPQQDVTVRILDMN